MIISVERSAANEMVDKMLMILIPLQEWLIKHYLLINTNKTEIMTCDKLAFYQYKLELYGENLEFV